MRDINNMMRCEMEAARNAAVDAYIEARPQLDSIHNRRIFEAGFERAWEQRQREIDKAPIETRKLPNGETVQVALVLVPNAPELTGDA